MVDKRVIGKNIKYIKYNNIFILFYNFLKKDNFYYNILTIICHLK